MKTLPVDDRVLFRQGLVRLIDAQPGFKVTGQANSVCEATEIACLPWIGAGAAVSLPIFC